MNALKHVMGITQAALNQKTYQEVIHDEKAFYQMIIENGLSGLIYQALDKDYASVKLIKHIENSFYQYVSRDEKQKQALQDIRTLLNGHGISFMFLKGARLKSIYPESYMRAMGDIDLLVHEEDLKNVHEVFEKANIHCTMPSKQHDLFEMKNGLVIEVHPRLYKDFNPKYAEIMGNPWAYAHPIKESEHEMIPEYEIIYLLYHLAKHMDASGIGLRSVLDIGIFANAHNKSINIKKLEEILERSDMRRFFDVMIAFNEVYFGFSFQWKPSPIEEISKETLESLLDYLVVSGIHGLGNAYNPMSSRIASYELMKKSKARLIMNMLFPSVESMKGMYPFVKRCGMLVIIAWPMRWLRLIFRKSKSSLHKIKQLQTGSDEVNKKKELFQKIGL